MLFYNLLFFSISCLVICEELIKPNKRYIFDILMFCGLCIVSSLHGIGGTDYFIYKNAYDQSPTIRDFFEYQDYYRNLIFSFEPGYLIIIASLKTLGFNFYDYIVIQSIFFYLAMYLGLKKYTNHMGLVILVFIYKMFFYDTFVSMRQPITIAGFLILLRYFYEGKTIKYLIGAFILSTIHYGAFILFPIYLLRYFRLTRKRIIILSIIFFPTAILSQYGFGANLGGIMSIINPAKGINYENSGGTINLAYTLEYYLLLTVAIIQYKKILQNKYGEFMLKIFLVALPIVTLFSGIIILRRELDYIFPIYGIIGGYICDSIRKYKFFVVFLFVAISYYGYQRYLKNFDDGGLIPYKTWMETKYS